MTTTPSIETVSSMSRIASTAAWSALSLSPRPIQRAAPIAAASVTRTSSRARFRSGGVAPTTPSYSRGEAPSLGQIHVPARTPVGGVSPLACVARPDRDVPLVDRRADRGLCGARDDDRHAGAELDRQGVDRRAARRGTNGRRAGSNGCAPWCREALALLFLRERRHRGGTSSSGGPAPRARAGPSALPGRGAGAAWAPPR